MAEAGKRGRYFEQKRRGDGDTSTRREGLREFQQRDVGIFFVKTPLHFLAVRREFKVFEIAQFLLIGEIESGTAVAEFLAAKSRTAVFEGVAPEVHPYFGQGIGRVVDVLNLDVAHQRVCRVIERRRDFVVYFLLEIIFLGKKKKRKKQ